MISYKEKLWRYLQEEEGFTLVELIVVVVIIGILSSIAIPSFQNSADKANQKEASTQVATYLRAAQAYFLENGVLPQHSAHLGQNVSVNGCGAPSPSACKNWTENYAIHARTVWYTPSGLYELRMESIGNTFYFRASADGNYYGMGVSGCFNSLTGATKLVEMTTKKNRTNSGMVSRISC